MITSRAALSLLLLATSTSAYSQSLPGQITAQPPPHNDGTDFNRCQVYAFGADSQDLGGASISAFRPLDDEIRAFIHHRSPDMTGEVPVGLQTEVKRALCDGAKLQVQEECTVKQTLSGGAECRDTRTFNISKADDREVCNVKSRMGSMNPPPDGSPTAHANVKVYDLIDPSAVDVNSAANYISIDIEELQHGLNNKRAWSHGWIDVYSIPIVSDEARKVVGCLPRGVSEIKLR